MALFDQQRFITRDQLRDEIEDCLSKMVPGNIKKGPDITILRKAFTALDEIMALVDSYSSPRRL